MKILIVGNSVDYSLEKSYYRAALNSNFEAHFIDYNKISRNYIRGGKIGKFINQLLPVEQWERKISRDIVIISKRIDPNVIIIFGNTKILYGALMTLKIISSKVKIVWVWPDTPLNLELAAVNNGLFVDLFGTYSNFSVPLFQKLNFNNIQWIPLGFDNYLHKSSISHENYRVDIGFVGGWRPERELVLDYVVANFPDLLVEIHGPNWKSKCQSKKLKSKVKSEGILGVDMANFFKSTIVNLNVIDDTNFPAANMRFFEISGTGAIQISSSCLEMSDTYMDFESCLYFNDFEELKFKINWVMNNRTEAKEIGLKAMKLTLEKNTYEDRLSKILKLLN